MAINERKIQRAMVDFQRRKRDDVISGYKEDKIDLAIRDFYRRTGGDYGQYLYNRATGVTKPKLQAPTLSIGTSPAMTQEERWLKEMRGLSDAAIKAKVQGFRPDGETVQDVMASAKPAPVYGAYPVSNPFTAKAQEQKGKLSMAKAGLDPMASDEENEAHAYWDWINTTIMQNKPVGMSEKDWAGQVIRTNPTGAGFGLTSDDMGLYKAGYAKYSGLESSIKQDEVDALQKAYEDTMAKAGLWDKMQQDGRLTGTFAGKAAQGRVGVLADAGLMPKIPDGTVDKQRFDAAVAREFANSQPLTPYEQWLYDYYNNNTLLGIDEQMAANEARIAELTSGQTYGQEQGSAYLQDAQEYERLKDMVASGQGFDTFTPEQRELWDAYESGNGLEWSNNRYAQGNKDLQTATIQNQVLSANRANIVMQRNYEAAAAQPDFKAKSVRDTAQKDKLYNFINDQGGKGQRANEILGIATTLVDEGKWLDAGYGFLRPEEIRYYNYIVATQGLEAGKNVLDELAPELALRRAQDVAEDAKKFAEDYGGWSTLATYGTNLVSGITAPFRAVDALVNPDHSYLSSMYDNQVFTDVVREARGAEWGKATDKWEISLGDWKMEFGPELGQWLYGLQTSGGDMLVAMAAGKGVQKLGGSAAVAKGTVQAIMSSEAGGATMYQAMEQGIDPGKAVVLGLGSAAIEWLTEKYSLEELLREPKHIRSYIAKNITTEASEEGASNLLNLAWDTVVLGDQGAIMTAYEAALEANGGDEKAAARQVLMDKLGELGMDMLGGALLGGGMASVPAASAGAKRYVERGKTGKAINANEAYSQLRSIALTLEGTKAQATAKGLEGKKISNQVAGRLYQQVMEGLSKEAGESVRQAMTQMVADRLTELGEKGDVQAGAAALQKMWMGGKLNAQDRAAIDSLDNAKQVMGEVFEQQMTDVATSAALPYQMRMTQVHGLTRKQAPKKAVNDAEISESLADDASVTFDNADAEKGFNAKTAQGEIMRVASIGDDPQIVVQTEGGKEETVPLSQLEADSYNTRYALGQISASGMSVESANEMLAYARVQGGNTRTFVNDFTQVYRDGVNGYGMTMASNMAYGKRLAPEIRQKAYDAGQRDSEAQYRAQVRRDQQKGKRRGKVTFEGITRESLNDQQLANVEVMEAIADKLGVDIVFFASKADAAGRYQGEQGSYKDGVIRLDVNAGRNNINDKAQYAILRTAAHELTHHIAERNRADYQRLQRFVVDNLMDKGLEQLIEEKQAQYAAQGVELTREQAIEEVVADGCEMMLKDSQAIQKLVEQDRNLAQKVLDWLRNFIDKLRKAFDGVSYEHREAALLMQKGTLKYLEGLQEMWDQALMGTVEGNTTGMDGAKLQARVSNRSMKMTHYYSVASKHVMRLNFSDQRLINALDYDPKERIDDFEEVISRLQTRALNGEDNITFETAMSKKGDEMKLILLEKQGDMRYSVVDVYKLSTAQYEGRVSVLIDLFEKGAKKRNEQELNSWLKLVGESYGIGLFFKYNRQTSRFVEIGPGTSGKRRTAAGAAGAGSNGGGTVGGGGQVKFALRSSVTETDTAYLDAIKRGDMAMAQRMVDEAAEDAFAKSKVRTPKGKLMKVYHGTKSDFTVFDTSKQGGVNGTAEGYGIYLSDSQEVTSLYGQRQIGAYADITYPATSWKKTLTASKLAKLIESTCKDEAAQMVEDAGYGNIREALPDTWISNYVDTYSNSMAYNYKAVANSIIRLNDNDMNIIQEVMAGMGIRDYASAESFYDKHLTPTTGVDGFWTKWDNQNTGQKNNIILALKSSQIKSADPVTYDDDGEVIPLSERFNREDDDIRYQLRDYSSLSEREILAGADPASFKMEGVRGFLEEYQGALGKLDELNAKLTRYQDEELNAQNRDEQVKARNRVQIAQKQLQDQENRVSRLEAREQFHKALEAERQSLENTLAFLDPVTIAGNIRKYEGRMKELEGLRKTANEARKLARALYKERNRWVKTSDVNELARDILKENGSTLKVSEVAPRIQNALETMANSTGDAYMNAAKALSQVAADIVRSAEAVMPSAYEELWQDLKGMTIHLTNPQKAEVKSVYGSMGAFRDAMRGAVTISEKGMGFTSQWGELSGKYPNLFPADATEGDMVYALAAAVELARPETYNPFVKEQGSATRQIAADLLERGTGVEVKLPAIELQKRRYEQRIGRLNERLKRVREQGADRLLALEMNLEAKRARNVRKLLEKQRQQKENFKRYRERTKDTQSRAHMRDRIKDEVKKLNKLLTQETDTKHVPEDLKGAVADFLTVFVQDTSVFSKAKLDELRYAYGKISDKASADEMSQLSAMYDEDITRDLEELRGVIDGKRLAELDASETKKVLDIVRHFNKLIKEANWAFVDGRRQSISTMVHTAVQQADAKKPYKEIANSTVSAVRKLLRTEQITPPYFFKELGGIMKQLWDDLKAGESKVGLNVQKAQDFFYTTADKYHYWDWAHKKNDVLEMTTQQGHKIALSREQAMGLYATWKREMSDNGQQAGHLAQGGFILEEKVTKGKNGKIDIDTRDPHKMTDGDMNQVASWLTEEQRGYVDEMVRYMSVDMAALGNETSMALFGYKKYGEPFYYPYNSSKNFTYTALGQQVMTNDQRLKHSSFTRKTVQFANNPIIASDFTQVWSAHVNHMILYNAMCVPLENFNRVYNGRYTDVLVDEETGEPMLDADGKPMKGSMQSVKQALEVAYGKNALRYIENLMADLNGGVRVRTDGMASALVGKFKKSAVMMSMSVVVQQPSAMVRAMALVNPKYFMPGLSMGGSWKELKKYSGIAVIKEMGGFDTQVGQSTQDWLIQRQYEGMEKLSKEALMDKGRWNDLMGWLPGKADQMTWTWIWGAVKAEVADKTGLTGEALMQEAAKRFDEVVAYTQVYDSTLSRSQLMRSKDGLAKMVTSFMSEPTLTYNMLMDALVNRGKADSVNPARAIGAFVATAVVNALLKSLVTAARDDDKEKSLAEKYVGNVVENVTNDVNPLNLIPYARDIVSLLQGYDVERTDMSLVNDLITGVQKALTDDDLTMYERVMMIAQPVAAAFGIPLKNVMRDLGAVVNVATGTLAPENSEFVALAALDALPFRDSGKTAYYERVLDARAAGDDREEELLTAYLTSSMGVSEKTIKSKTKEALGNRYKAGRITDSKAIDILTDYYDLDDDDAYWQLKEWREKAAHKEDEDFSFSRQGELKEALENGNSQKVKAAQKELTDNGYAEKDVYSDTRSAIKAMYKDGTITWAKAKSLLTSHGGSDWLKEQDTHSWYWLEKEWAYDKANKDNKNAPEYNKYATFKAAIPTGKGLYAAARELLDHGVEKGDISGVISKTYKEEYIRLQKTDKTKFLELRARILTAYDALGYKRSDRIKHLDKYWVE